MFNVWQPNSTTTMYCCGDVDSGATNESDACLDGGAPFAVPVGTPLVGFAGLVNDEVIPSSLSFSTSSSSTIPPTSARATSISTTGTDPAKTDSITSPSSTCSPASCRAQQQYLFSIGVAVFAALGILIFSVLMWTLWERRKRFRFQMHNDIAMGQVLPPDEKANLSRETFEQQIDREHQKHGKDGHAEHRIRKLKYPLGELPDAVPAAAEMADYRSTRTTEFRRIEN